MIQITGVSTHGLDLYIKDKVDEHVNGLVKETLTPFVLNTCNFYTDIIRNEGVLDNILKSYVDNAVNNAISEKLGALDIKNIIQKSMEARIGQMDAHIKKSVLKALESAVY